MNHYLYLEECTLDIESPLWISPTPKWAAPSIGAAMYIKTFRNMTDLVSYVRSTRRSFVFWSLIRTIPNESHYELRFGLNRMEGLDLTIGRDIIDSDPTIVRLDPP
jgi:hypothetical protein